MTIDVFCEGLNKLKSWGYGNLEINEIKSTWLGGLKLNTKDGKIYHILVDKNGKVVISGE